MKTLAIVGAGPGLGFSLAKTFGQRDYRVALIARSQEKLDSYVQQLQALHIEAVGFAANVTNTSQLGAALARVKETLVRWICSSIAHFRAGQQSLPRPQSRFWMSRQRTPCLSSN